MHYDLGCHSSHVTFLTREHNYLPISPTLFIWKSCAGSFPIALNTKRKSSTCQNSVKRGVKTQVYSQICTVKNPNACTVQVCSLFRKKCSLLSGVIPLKKSYSTQQQGQCLLCPGPHLVEFSARWHLCPVWPGLWAAYNITFQPLLSSTKYKVEHLLFIYYFDFYSTHPRGDLDSLQ